MSALLPCPECRRHVRVDASACPFCSAALALTPPAPLPVLGRLTRAAVFAGAALAATACGSNQAKPKELPRNAAADGGAAMTAPPDAGPAIDQNQNQQYIHQQPMPYGAPPARDRFV